MIKIALLEVDTTSWLVHMLLASPGIEIYALRLPDSAIPYQNPYHLPETSVVDTVVVTSNYIRWVEASQPEQLNKLCAVLHQKFRKVVGLDVTATFGLSIPPHIFDKVEVVIKGQGLYRDRDLYNYQLGSKYSIGNWTQKNIPLKDSYSPSQLDKLRLSVPCFTGIIPKVRQRVRQKLPAISAPQQLLRQIGDFYFQLETSLLSRTIQPKQQVNFIGALTHYSRVVMLNKIKEAGLQGYYGITNVPAYIWGYQKNKELNKNERSRLRSELETAGLMAKRLNRIAYKRTMFDHKIILSPNGYGELAFRHAEAWQMRRALIAQDVSHVEMMFSLQDGENVAFCKPDFSDLVPLINQLLSDEHRYEQLVNNAYSKWNNWSKQYDSILYNGIVHHLE